MSKPELEVAWVTYGHSSYHDAVWGWLNQHAAWFDDYGHEMADAYDYWRAWGLLALVGCKVKCYGYEDAPAPYAKDWGEGVTITFDGNIEELLMRLDTLMPKQANNRKGPN